MPYISGAHARRDLVRAGTAAAGCLLVLALAPSVASARYAEEARSGSSIVEATFSEPPDGGSDLTLTQHLTALIDNADPSADIRVALHSLSGTASADFRQALISKAQNKRDQGLPGVVKVIYDGTKLGDANSTVRQFEASLIAAGGTFVECHRVDSPTAGGCLAATDTSSLQHAKYVLISRTQKTSGTIGLGWHDNVSWIGSANMSPASGWEANNDAVTVYTAGTLYQGLVGIFDKAAAQTWPSNDFYDNPAGNGFVSADNPNVSIWASPEATAGHDMVLARLDQVTPGSGCVIRMMEEEFNGDRANDIADRLAYLNTHGCDVRILVSGGDDGRTWDVGDKPKPVLCSSTNSIELRAAKKVHDKSLMIAGVYAGNTFKRVAFTGSHNISDAALRRNDEILARVGEWSGDAVYNAFRDHFDAPWKANIGNVVC